MGFCSLRDLLFLPNMPLASRIGPARSPPPKATLCVTAACHLPSEPVATLGGPGLGRHLSNSGSVPPQPRLTAHRKSV